MAYRNLTFRSLASDIRLETYLGEEHLVIPCIALVGDEVVYGMNAEGPEFVPAEELELSTLGWGDRPVLYDHPPISTSSACEPRTLEAMSFGRTFFPRFEDKKLKLEAWCNKRRAEEIDQGELLNAAERGEVIELSVGVITSLERKKGIAPNGKPYSASWFNIQSDHLAIGLQGSEGACNIEMGCGANRMMKAASPTVDENGDFRTMRALRGVEDMNPTEKQKTAPSVPEQSSDKPQSKMKKILSFASRVFRSNAEDEGLSDFELRSKLWDVLYSIEPAFSGIEDVYQDSKTVRYITQPTYPEPKMFLWRRTYTVAEDGAVTVNDDREEVDFAVNYIYLSGKETAQDSKPCGCQTIPSGQTTAPSGQTVSASETNTETYSSIEPKGENVMPDEKPKTEDKNKTTAVTPEAGSSEAATPSQSGNEDKTVPNYPAGQTNPPHTDTDSKPLTEDEQIEKLPAPVRDMVRHYQAVDKAEHDRLVGSLSKSQKVYTTKQLEAKSTKELREIADLVGVQRQPSGDFSGRMMVARENELPPPPDPWGVAKHLKRSGGDSAN